MLFLYIAIGCLPIILLGMIIGSLLPYSSKQADYAYMTAGIAFCTAIVSLILMIIGSVVLATQHEEKWIKDYQYDIVASNDSSKTEGRFGLFSGRIDEQAVYIYYYPLGNGRYEQGWIAERLTTIVETKEDNGHIIVYKDADCENTWYGMHSCNNEKRFDLVVPEGSIIQQHQFDLED